MKISKIVIVFTFLFMAVQAISAQKIGHINSGNILALMPDAAKADSGLVLYRNELVAKGDSAGRAFEKEYKAFVEAYNAGTLSQIQVQKRQEELQKAQQTLQAYAQEIDARIANLRRQLLQPILEKLDDAIRAIGKEGNYQAIFDSSTGSTLFAQESDDVSELVKKKLGLK
ncbi:MAG: OmpH family outer membrane protein [Saprospiraceae bacterium]|nr:OmpH family outer membrane protein [Saprospiraceae bacterium]